MNKTATRPLPALPIPAPANIRVLWCDTCRAYMPHSITKSRTAYVCSCGTELEFHINDSPATWAIR